ncbi:MAG: YdcF family protein [Alphaproteobacteria bacterium]|nr:YdcF family protein [Alphaproteobacteria bacterium]
MMRRVTLFFGFLAVAAWLGGLVVFVGSIDAMREPTVDTNLQITDGIVVLTGGSERVTTGLELLESGRGKKLFISGVHKGLTLDGIVGSQPVPDNLRSCCIVLGHLAGSTFGNADETDIWMNLENYRSLRLVTANYHMPRSLLVFHAAMPDIVIVPHPVVPDSVKLDDWWRHPGTVDLLVTEYMKYLAAFVRVKVMGP